MDKQLDTSFNRVEKALGALIDSIAKYNPSAAQVQELGNADAELSKGLEDLSNHQYNYQRILDLRAQTARQDAQIKDTLRLLANTRKELVNATATASPDGQPRYEVRYDELLSYARRISKTTIPPVGALNAVAALNAAAADKDKALLLAQQLKSGENSTLQSASETAVTTPAADVATPTNGISTQAGTAVGTPTALNGASFDNSSALPPSQSAASAAGELPEPLANFLNPHSGYTFVPWPSEEQIRHGAIASLAYIAEQGISAEGYDPAIERRREEDERRQAEERDRLEREERERRVREQRELLKQRQEEEMRRANAAATGATGSQQSPQSGGAGGASLGGQGGQQSPVSAAPAAKTQFQFMGDDDDDDDD